MLQKSKMNRFSSTRNNFIDTSRQSLYNKDIPSERMFFMKKKIGIVAAIAAIIDLLIYAVLIVTGNAFTNIALTAFLFIMWFVLIITTGICLFGEVIKYIGKQFSAGYNSNQPVQPNATVFCTKCGKPIASTVSFCPHCGERRV